MLLVGNGALITRDPENPFIKDGCVAINGTSINSVGATAEMRAKYPAAKFIDAKGGLISCREVGRGVVNAAEVSVRTIVETALSQKAVSVILSHNHVDAYALPSREDELTTKRVRDALLLVGITLADHIIVCGEDYVSFADSGLL